MANFMDLPKPVRQQIYRLHLVRTEKITGSEHSEMVERKYGKDNGWPDKPTNLMPPICYVSAKIETEAAPVYYGENHFTFRHSQSGMYNLLWKMATRHRRLVRKVTIDWPTSGAYWVFRDLASLSRLEELYIGVDEVEMVWRMLPRNHRYRLWQHWPGPTPQQQLSIRKYPGMSSLLNRPPVAKVHFVKEWNGSSIESGGPIAGGVLETQIAPQLAGLIKADESKKHANHDAVFPFMDLPPELRNRIYGLLLLVDGPVHPAQTPSSLRGHNKGKAAPQSVLSILATNHQIHDEAVGMFYAKNALEFEYPTQLHHFINNLSKNRLNSIRDITFHYSNVSSGGINIIDLTMPLLKQLHLRRLHIICQKQLAVSGSSWSPLRYLPERNPLFVPGLRYLFELRGIEDILVRDLHLERQLKEIKSKEGTGNSGSNDNYYLQVEKIVAYFNAAVADAQKGRINDALLKDGAWHMKDPFPTTKDNSNSTLESR